MEREIKILLTKIGLDAHTKGIRLLAEILKNSGMNVINIGHYKWPAQIVEAAIKDDVDVIGISTLVANYELVFELMRLLKQKNVNDKVVIVGGTIAREHALKLKEAGVNEVFLPGAGIQSIIDYIRSHVSVKS